MALQLARELAHWRAAIDRLRDLELRAPASAWSGLEGYLGIEVRQRLLEAVDRVEREGEALRPLLDRAEGVADTRELRRGLVRLRRSYSRAETTVDFFGDAINTRSSLAMARLLSACDVIAVRSMHGVLDRLGKDTPRVLTYVDKGLGASILKRGLRLWDGGTVNPVAVIKVVFHNLMRPTSIVHEAGHQVAHIIGWNEELGEALRGVLAPRSAELAEIWAGWASEIAADAYAFAHTGYASVASLHDVLSGGERFVYRFAPGDPHPISFLRVLLGVELCRAGYGAGAWDPLERCWLARHDPALAPTDTRRVVRASLPLLPDIARSVLTQPMQAFGGRSLSESVDPRRARPSILESWERRSGEALYRSPHLIGRDPLRLLALSNYRLATRPHLSAQLTRRQEGWMLHLGASVMGRARALEERHPLQELAV